MMMTGMASDFEKPKKDGISFWELQQILLLKSPDKGLEQNGARDGLRRFCNITTTTYIMYHTSVPAEIHHLHHRRFLAGFVTK